MSFKERLFKYIDYKGVTNADFEKKASLSNGSVNKMGENTRTSTLDKISNSYPDLNINWLRTGEGAMLIEEHNETLQPQISYSNGVPYYDVDFIGGFDLILNDQTVNPAYLIDFHKYNSADCWCNVTGNSMHPEITHGDIIALKEIKEWSTFLPFGEVYAVVTEEHRTIKKITGGKSDDNFLLIPTNQSKEYKPQEVPKSIIRKVYRVLGCMKKI